MCRKRSTDKDYFILLYDTPLKGVFFVEINSQSTVVPRKERPYFLFKFFLEGEYGRFLMPEMEGGENMIEKDLGKGPEPEPELMKMPMSVDRNGAITIVTLKPTTRIAGRYMLEMDPEQSDQISGAIGIQYSRHEAVIDCSECPALQRGEISEWTVQMNPNGYSRRRIDPDTRISLESDALRYNPAHLARKRSARANKYRRWLGETRHDRFPGFYKG